MVGDRLHRPQPVFTKCVVCDRLVFRLVEEVDVIARIEVALRSSESSRSLHIALQSQPSWLFHGHMTDFPAALASVVRNTRWEMEPLRTHIQSICGIPTREQIVRTIAAWTPYRSSTHTMTAFDDALGIPDDVWEPIDPLS